MGELTSYQKELLARLRAENAASGSPFTPGPHWIRVNEKFDEWFQVHGIGEIPYQPYDEHFAGIPRKVQNMREFIEHMGGNEEEMIIRYSQWLLVERIMRKDTLKILENNFIYDMRGWGTLTALASLYSIHEHVPILTSPTVVADLGAGWGRIGYVLKSYNDRASYIAYDLPESLLISSSYLPALLPDIHTCEVGMLEHKPGMYFLLPHQIEELPDKYVEALINIASLGEMTKEQVEEYFDIIERKSKYFYTLQGNGRARVPDGRWRKIFDRKPLWSGKYYEAMYEL